MSFPNSYIKYKQDSRITLDFSQIRSEKYVTEEEEKAHRLKTIFKYRLYGKDGISEIDKQNLVNWGILKIKKLPHGVEPSKIKVRKKIIKKKVNKYTGEMILQLSEKSGSRDSAFEYKIQHDYVYNDDNDDFFYLNEGF